MATTIPHFSDCINDPLNNNRSVLAKMSDGTLAASTPANAKGTQSVLSAAANGSQEHGKAAHPVG